MPPGRGHNEIVLSDGWTRPLKLGTKGTNSYQIKHIPHTHTCRHGHRCNGVSTVSLAFPSLLHPQSAHTHIHTSTPPHKSTPFISASIYPHSHPITSPLFLYVFFLQSMRRQHYIPYKKTKNKKRNTFSTPTHANEGREGVFSLIRVYG